MPRFGRPVSAANKSGSHPVTMRRVCTYPRCLLVDDEEVALAAAPL